MPTSHPRTLSTIHQLLLALSPRSVIDIGVGHGKTGVLLREYLEMWDNRAFEKSQWRSRIYGVEVFEGYRNPLWSYAYDDVVVCDALEGLDRLPKVDVVVALDVWEHFEREYARAVLARSLEKAAYLLISTPIEPLPQDAAYQNHYERHVSRWCPNDFSAVPFRAVACTEEDWCILLSSSKSIPQACAKHARASPLLLSSFRSTLRLWRHKGWNRFGSATFGP